MGLFDAFRGIKRILTGEVIQQIDTPVFGGMTIMSLRLKKEKNSNECYVVLAGLSRGNYQYFSFTKSEFAEFANAVEVISDSLMRGPRTAS
jgi:hypothetical protein